MMLNLNNKSELLQFLLSIEFSMYCPAAERVHKKACPYCGRWDKHEPECELNNSIITLMEGNFTVSIKNDIHNRLREVEWSGFHQLCPSCNRMKGEGHTPTCPMNTLIT